MQCFGGLAQFAAHCFLTHGRQSRLGTTSLLHFQRFTVLDLQCFSVLDLQRFDVLDRQLPFSVDYVFTKDYGSAIVNACSSFATAAKCITP